METITSEQPTVPVPAGTDIPLDEPVVPSRSPLRAAIKTGRPQEWIKNFFVFAGLLFSGKFNQPHDVLEATLTFVSFCLVSSAGYYVNDLVDVELDRKHPKKRFRPLAARELSEGAAKAIAPMLAFVAVGLAFATVNWEVGLMVIGYGIIQLSYSLWLKQVVIIDVMTLATVFILRVAAGAVAVDAHASEWLLLCTGMLALFLGFTKRRQEAVSELHEGTSSRPVLEHYSLPFLDQMVAMVTTGTVISYSIYAVNSPIIGSKMMWTIPAGGLRHLPLPVPDLRPGRRSLDCRDGLQRQGAWWPAAPPGSLSLSSCSTCSSRLGPTSLAG